MSIQSGMATRRRGTKGECLTLLGCILLAGCSAAQKDETLLDQDAAYEQAIDAGSQALALERFAVAERQYRETARLALRRDDPAAIHDAAYDLAVTQLAAGEADKALDTTQIARQTLRVRQDTDHPVVGGLPTGSAPRAVPHDMGDLDLAAAAALYRLGRFDEAARMAAAATRSSDQDVARRGIFLAGLVAAQQPDNATLSRSITALAAVPPPHSAVLNADLAELRALAVLGASPGQAMGFAATSAELRRQTGEYRAMARALALEGRAAQAAGQTAQASELFARAAQSEGARNNTDATPDALADRYMMDAGPGFTLRPFQVKDTSDDKKNP